MVKANEIKDVNVIAIFFKLGMQLLIKRAFDIHDDMAMMIHL
jgi:hypothetical protein